MDHLEGMAEETDHDCREPDDEMGGSSPNGVSSGQTDAWSHSDAPFLQRLARPRCDVKTFLHMVLRIDEGLLDYMRQSSGAAHVQLRDVADREHARVALSRARESIFRIPHPDQPDEPFASYASGLEAGGRGPQFWFDMADAEAFPDVLECAIELILIAIEHSGVKDGCLTWPASDARQTTAWTRSPEGRWASVLEVFTDDPQPDSFPAIAPHREDRTGRWERRKPLPTLRSRMAAVTASTGRIYAVGGDRRAPVRTVEVYDPATDTWEKTASLLEARRGPGVAKGPDGVIYALGGYGSRAGSVEAYDPATRKWQYVAPMLDEPLNDMAAATAPDGCVYALSVEGKPNFFQVYEPPEDKWSPLAAPGQRYWGLVTLVCCPDGRLYALGTPSPDAPSVVAEMYDPSSDVWVDMPPFDHPRWGFGAAVGRDLCIYVMGGTRSFSTFVPAVERYDVAQQRWTTVDRLPTPRAIVAITAAIDGSIYAIGGFVEAESGVGEDVGTVEVYSPA